MNIRLRGNHPNTYIGSDAFIALDCDCHHIAGGGNRSGFHDGNPVYHITWPQHPEYHDKYIAITDDGIKIL